jgi:hypothetical protein
MPTNRCESNALATPFSPPTRQRFVEGILNERCQGSPCLRRQLLSLKK